MRTHGTSEELSVVGMAREQRVRGRWLEMKEVVDRSAEPGQVRAFGLYHEQP